MDKEWNIFIKKLLMILINNRNNNYDNDFNVYDSSLNLFIPFNKKSFNLYNEIINSNINKFYINFYINNNLIESWFIKYNKYIDNYPHIIRLIMSIIMILPSQKIKNDLDYELSDNKLNIDNMNIIPLEINNELFITIYYSKIIEENNFLNSIVIDYYNLETKPIKINNSNNKNSNINYCNKKLTTNFKILNKKQIINNIDKINKFYKKIN